MTLHDSLQARWALVCAIELLRSHAECYDVIVDALERRESVGQCVAAVEVAYRRRAGAIQS